MEATLERTRPRIPPRPDTLAVGRFYDRVAAFYPLVDLFCGSGRARLIAHINRQPAGRLLEVGVGPGRHLRRYRRHAVTAIDCSVAMVSRSQRQAGGAVVRRMDGEQLEFADGSFDYVVLSHVLAVTRDPARMLGEARRVLRGGGLAFVLNHETPVGLWRHIEAAAMPLGRRIFLRTWFRVREVEGFAAFRGARAVPGGWLGWVNAWALEK